MEENVFDRIEKKYLITERQKKALIPTIKKNMSKDNYYKSEVYNLYFDNQNYDLIDQSINWTDFKEKIRARSYSGYDRVFLEIKTKLRAKDNNLGYKRRVMITHRDFNKLVKGIVPLEELAKKHIENNNDIQIAREVDYLIKTLKLEPKILVIYNRESYKTEKSLRITFDENLRYRNKNLKLISMNSDKIYFEDDPNIIMEIKAQGSMPLWLVKKLSEQKIYPRQFSKIGNIYQKIRKEHNV